MEQRRGDTQQEQSIIVSQDDAAAAQEFIDAYFGTNDSEEYEEHDYRKANRRYIFELSVLGAIVGAMIIIGIIIQFR